MMLDVAHVPDRFPTASEFLGHASVTPVSELFFSKLNFEALQTGIINLVYRHSGCKYRIGRQSDTELSIIMIGVYREHGRNLPYNVTQQVRRLNVLVLDFAVPRIIREVQMHMQYQSEALQNPLPPMIRPVDASVAGTKTLEFNRV